MARQDYRDSAARWSRFSEVIPPGAKVLAITQSYGFPLSYYGWINVTRWPTSADTELRLLAGLEETDLEARRFDLLDEHDLFLVTHFSEFEKQPDLEAHLYANYPLIDEGEGYLLFDLNPAD